MKTFFILSAFFLITLSYSTAESISVPANGMLFEKITRISIDNSIPKDTPACGVFFHPIEISNGQKQMVTLNLVDMSKEKPPLS